MLGNGIQVHHDVPTDACWDVTGYSDPLRPLKVPICGWLLKRVCIRKRSSSRGRGCPITKNRSASHENIGEITELLYFISLHSSDLITKCLVTGNHVRKQKSQYCLSCFLSKFMVTN